MLIKLMTEKKDLKNVTIEFHADDYGLFPTQSHRILDCRRNGNLNGVSIMPNSLCLEECVSDLFPFMENLAVTVHLNLIEGNSICKREEIPLLTDEAGRLNSSFGRLLLRSFLPGRNAYREQLKKEFRAQIRAVQGKLEPGTPLRLDGHAHYHMIPVVFDAMMDVIREENLPVSYIRIPREYPMLYLRHIGKLKDLALINLVKFGILNLLSVRAYRKYGRELEAMEQKVFMGVFLSGSMYYENVIHILPDAIALAQKLGKGLEILAHPGGVYEEDDISQITFANDLEFLTSRMRDRERSMFLIKNGAFFEEN